MFTPKLAANKATSFVPKTYPLGALPFLLLLLLQGIPLSGTLSPYEAKWREAKLEDIVSQASRSGLEDSLIPTIILGSIYFLAILVLRKNGHSPLSPLTREWPLLVFFGLLLYSLTWVGEPFKVMTNIVHNAGVILVCFAAALAYRYNLRALPEGVGVVLGINTLIHLAAVYLIPDVALGIHERWRGLASHPNTLGGIAFISVWANSAALAFKTTKRRWLHIIFLFIAFILLAGAQSVTSISCALITILGILWFKLLHLFAGRKRVLAVSFLVPMLLLSGLVVVEFLGVSWWFDLFDRSSDLTGRTGLWQLAILAYSERPLFGWGYDGGALVSQRVGLAYSSFHNGYLDLLTRGGLTLAILFLVLLLRSLTSAFRTALEARMVFLPLICSILIYNVSEASLFLPRTLSWQILLLSIFFIGLKAKEAKNFRTIDRGQPLQHSSRVLPKPKYHRAPS
jgi:exopolysaccharide production protein ExoQ